MSKTVKTYLPDDLADKATKKAKAQKMSLSSYIQSLIKADTKKEGELDFGSIGLLDLTDTTLILDKDKDNWVIYRD